MKTKHSLLTFLFFLAITFALPLDGFSQKKGGPPSWAPAHGYRAKTRHIYFPDHNIYYDLQKGSYIYLSGRNWEVSVNLPKLFSGLNLNTSAKIELDLNTDSPQKYNNEHIVKYKAKGVISSSKKSKKHKPGKINKN